MKALALLVAALAGTAAAEPAFPKLYDVVGIDDALNLRDGPSSSAEEIGTLPPDTTGIEVLDVSENGYWMQVALPEGSGWAAAGYLKPHPEDAGVLFATSMQCGGVEPFWSLDITQGDSAVFSRMESDDVTLPAGKIRKGTKQKGRYFLDLGDTHAALLVAEQCSDTMSDRPYGVSVNLVIDQSTILRGCCSLRP
ncbi:MAG: peptide-binding protein [Rhodobacteraceae bacterium]|nr:peptide-binding protein [Paracoccaceae bacterium]